MSHPGEWERLNPYDDEDEDVAPGDPGRTEDSGAAKDAAGGRAAELAPGGTCWSCAERLTAHQPHCPSCGMARTHLVLTCAALRLDLSMGAGRPLRIGRDPAWAPLTAAHLSELRRVSRQQVTVQIEPDGTGWAEEPAKGTSNGTYLSTLPLRAGERTPLRDGDELRVGREVVSFCVRLYGPGAASAPGPQ